MNVFEHEHDIESILFHQVRPHGFLTPAIESALQSVNRMPFLPPACADVAYGDGYIPLKRRCELPFFVLARLLQSLQINPTDHVAVISSGTGYSATLLSRLAASVEAYESDSILFVRLIDMTRGNSTLTPVSTLTQRPADIILMDGGSHDAVPQSVQDKLLPGGRIAFVQLTDESPTLDAPLCQAVIWQKTHDGGFDAPIFVCQLHLPRLNTGGFENQSFHF